MASYGYRIRDPAFFYPGMPSCIRGGVTVRKGAKHEDICSEQTWPKAPFSVSYEEKSSEYQRHLRLTSNMAKNAGNSQIFSGHLNIIIIIKHPLF